MAHEIRRSGRCDRILHSSEKWLTAELASWIEYNRLAEGAALRSYRPGPNRIRAGRVLRGQRRSESDLYCELHAERAFLGP